MSEKTVRKYRDSERLPSQTERPARTYRTRVDPLSEFWPEIEALLEKDSRLKPYAILDWLKQNWNPDDGPPRVTDAIRCTLERRILNWKLRHGVRREVRFPQIHHPVRRPTLSDRNKRSLSRFIWPESVRLKPAPSPPSAPRGIGQPGRQSGPANGRY